MNSLNRIMRIYSTATSKLDFIAPLLDLALRIWVADVFFKSGLVKIQSWESTLMLFEYEYQVPLLEPSVAAWLGTAAELSLPLLLFSGLFSRPAALALLIFNFVAASSYPDISPAGIKEHMMWGVMLAVTLVHGPGKISIDHWLYKKQKPYRI